MATSWYKQPWVLLSHPEFRMSPGVPNFKPSPYPNFVMYKHRTPPRSFEPANTELAGGAVAGGAAPGMKSAHPPQYDYPVAHSIDDPAEGFHRHSHGTASPGQQVHTPLAPRIHGVSGSTPGYTATGVPQRPSALTVVGGSTPARPPPPPPAKKRPRVYDSTDRTAPNPRRSKLTFEGEPMDMP